MMTSTQKVWEGMIPTEIRESYERWFKAAQVLTIDAQPQVGLTPKEVIWKKNKMKLYRYISNEPKKFKTPLLMIYALINKPYILDLSPGNSFVEYLVNQGFDVYMIDWGTPGLEDQQLTIDDYVLDYIPKVVKKVLKTSGAKDLSILGYCMGGTMTSIFASLHPEVPIKNLIFMTSPFSFENAGLYNQMTDERYFNLDGAVDVLGNIPGDMIDFGNKMLSPLGSFYGPYVNLVDKANNEKVVEKWKLMQKWLTDGIPFPGEAYRQWIGEFYQKDKLIKGEFMIRGKKVDLSSITANVLNMAAEHDQIAQPHQVEALMDVISSKDKTYKLLPTGHVSVTFGSKARQITYPTVGEWLAERSK